MKTPTWFEEFRLMLTRSTPYLTFLVILLGAVVCLYMMMHGADCVKGFEFQKLTETDEAQLRALVDAGVPTDSLGKERPNFRQNINRRQVERFLTMRFEQWEKGQRNTILQLIQHLPDQSVVTFLAATKFKVRSYFWSTGKAAYLEIGFWTLFGVLCSILYYVTEAIRNRAKDPTSRGFDPDEIPNHFARLAYAPIVSLILVFGYQFFSGEQFAAIETGKGMLIISFLLGFYSGRAMKLLDKIKEILLPFGGEEAQRAAQGRQVATVPRFTARLVIDPSVRSADPQALNDQLDAATVTLTRKSDGSRIALERHGEDQEAVFMAKDLAAGTYALTAELDSTLGIGLFAEQDVDLTQQTDVEVMLKEGEAVG